MRCKRVLLLALCLAVVLAPMASLTARAEKSGQKVVRVGWYESAFHRTDPFGRRSGYGYEYQQRVATFTGWTYEYVEGSWSELYEMLVAGQIDLLSDVSYTPERAEKILYSAESMGAEDYHAFIAPDNTEIRPDDFSTFNGKRVGVNKNSIQEKLFIEWADSHGVEPRIVELSGKTPELLDMLARGEIDALVTLDTYGNSADVVPVCRVGFAESFFGVNRARPDIKRELDTAMSRMRENNRDFNQQLTEKFNKASAVNSFLTAEETEWLSDHPVIRVGYRDNFLPYCDLDDGGTLTGALADYLAFAETCEKNARLNFETFAFDTTEAALNALRAGEIDCVFPINLSTYDGEQLGVIITDPFVSTEMYAAVRTADHMGVSPEREMTVAVLKGHPNHETFLRDYFPNWQIRYCDDSAACFRAVAEQDADCTLVSNYRIERVSRLCAENDLSTLATGEAMELCFGMNRADDCLYSIFNKVNHLIPDTVVNSSLTNYSFRDERVTFLDFWRDNFPYVVATVALVIAAFLLLALRSAKESANAKEGRQIISETERDPLTLLYNREFFIAYVIRFHREQPNVPMDAVALNIDRFHTLNSLNGREFGDDVLRVLGAEITEFTRESGGICGRVGSDHFDIYCPHRADYAPLLERFQSAMDVCSDSMSIRLRMGVMPWEAGVSPDQMFTRAWSACSMARDDYPVHLTVYDDELRRRDELSLRLRNDLARALDARELEVFYQPKYDIRPEQPRLSSAEALVRWQHPEFGMISPDQFIHLFEQSGQISALDNYVWAEAARQMAEWRDRYGRVLPVSVNLSRMDVFDPNLSATLDDLLARHNLEHRDLKLEVTESAYTENADHLIRVIGALREKGYEIEMDDFGSGYSSLNMLSSMPIDVLKMDIAFIRNIERDEKDLRLVELIVDIARCLRVPVVAEGVETEKQLSILREIGCDLVQGYYFSEPLSADEFERTILSKAFAAPGQG